MRVVRSYFFFRSNHSSLRLEGIGELISVARDGFGRLQSQKAIPVAERTHKMFGATNYLKRQLVPITTRCSTYHCSLDESASFVS